MGQGAYVSAGRSDRPRLQLLRLRLALLGLSLGLLAFEESAAHDGSGSDLTTDCANLEVPAFCTTTGNSCPAGVPGLASPESEIGHWDPVAGWPAVQATHTTLLSTGAVLFWRGRRSTDPTTTAYLWDPTNNTISQVLPYGTDLFCSGHGMLPNGKAIAIGGNIRAVGFQGQRHTSIFDPFSRVWEPSTLTQIPDHNDMAFGRWYPTATTLADGRMLVSSGLVYDRFVDPDYFSKLANVPEVYDQRTDAWVQLAGAKLTQPLYPFHFVLPDGTIFFAGPSTATRKLNIAAQTWTFVANAAFHNGAGSAAMYQPGKVLRLGGGNPPTNRAQTIDIAAPSPTWSDTGSMRYPRWNLNLVLLPDGTALAVGGAVSALSCGQYAVHAPEIWNPSSGLWSEVASMTETRMYHSTALLVPDGRVLAAGGENSQGAETNAEVYSPPYLFKGPRPRVDSHPTSVSYGQKFKVATPEQVSIRSVAFLRPGSVTHAFDQNQRYVPLSFRLLKYPNIEVTAPDNGNIAPPGRYMLFLVDRNGVPSIGRLVQVGPPGPTGSVCNHNGVCDPQENCSNCSSDCLEAPVCGNGICEAGDGEDCVSCGQDCNGQQGGKTENRFCCGDGDGQFPVPCTDSRCFSGGFACFSTSQGSYCCGNGVCEQPGETNLNCEVDCATGTVLTVTSFSLSCVQSGRAWMAQVAVTVVERDSGFPVEAALVRGEWSLAVTEEAVALTNVAGQAWLRTNGIAPGPARFQFILTDVEHPGLTYDPRGSVQTQNSIVCGSL